jgi:hypothetical protein
VLTNFGSVTFRQGSSVASLTLVNRGLITVAFSMGQASTRFVQDAAAAELRLIPGCTLDFQEITIAAGLVTGSGVLATGNANVRLLGSAALVPNGTLTVAAQTLRLGCRVAINVTSAAPQPLQHGRLALRFSSLNATGAQIFVFGERHPPVGTALQAVTFSAAPSQVIGAAKVAGAADFPRVYDAAPTSAAGTATGFQVSRSDCHGLR